MTSLADIERSYVSAGRALYPLQSVEDAAALLRAAAAVPAHAPSRSRRIVDKLQAVGSALAGRASEMLLNIDGVLAGMQSRPSVERLVNELPPTTSCTALHYFSYAAGGTLLEGSSIQPYPDCTRARYIHFTSCTVWETALLERYGHELLHAQVSAATGVLADL